MLYSLPVLAVALLTGASAFPNKVARAACNADNCLRAVRASSAKPYPSSALADCSSFFAKTVTPCVQTFSITETILTGIPTVTTTTSVTATESVPTTIIETVKSTLTITVDSSSLVPRNTGLLVRQPVSVVIIGTSCNPVEAPTKVPTYASACSGTVRYSSACACVGVTQATITLAPSSTTLTFTVTDTTDLTTPTSTETLTVATTTTTYEVTETVTETIKESVCSAPSPTALCNGSCLNTETDKNNCGACGNMCPAGKNTCKLGKCVSINVCTSLNTKCGPTPTSNCACFVTTENTGYCGATSLQLCGIGQCNSSADCTGGFSCLPACKALAGTFKGLCGYQIDIDRCSVPGSAVAAAFLGFAGKSVDEVSRIEESVDESK